MGKMTEKEVENYRFNEFPQEIDFLMACSLESARQLDKTEDETQKDKIFIVYIELIKTLKDRAEYYYKKRLDDFGVEHMRLRKLITSCKEILN